MRRLKRVVELILVICSCANSLMIVDSVETQNLRLCVTCLIFNLMILLVICKYGRNE